MKKLLVILSIVALVMSASSCNENSAMPNATSVTTTENKPKSITLTKSNYRSYINFDTRYSQTGSKTLLGLPSKEGEVYFSVYPIEAGSFKNVSIKVKLSLSHPWIFHDQADSDNTHKTINFKLSANGEYDFSTRVGGIDRGSPSISCSVVSISGEFILEN